VLGSGYRASLYFRIAKALPEQFEICMVLCHSEESACRVKEKFDFPVTCKDEDMINSKPDFVVSAVTKTLMCDTVEKWLNIGIPVLSETPVSLDNGRLFQVWENIKNNNYTCNKLQVAEQYAFYPTYDARIQIVKSGLIGEPVSMTISCMHDYHAVSIIREFLDTGINDVNVIGKAYQMKVTDTKTRYEILTKGDVVSKEEKHLIMEYDNEKTAFYDFMSDQYRSDIRNRFINVRGTRGEITDNMVYFLKDNNVAASEKMDVYKDEETGEILNRDNFTREQWDEKFGVKVPLPWNSFRDELDIRLLNEDPKNFLLTHADVQRELDYPGWMYGEEESPIEEGRYINYIRPLFVSRMPNHKVTGSAHDATIRSARDYETRGVVITKVPLTDLKLNKDNEIEGYYDKDSDRLLYQALVRQLLLHGNDGKKAFAEDFHKPKADGTEGPVVRKVKIEKKQTSGVMVRGGTGIAANGEMVRIDVFRENGKYYFVPVYTADVVRKVLPNRAATHTKPYSEWRVMDDANFVFSLYSRDLIHVKSKKDIKTNLVNGGLLLQKEIFAYYTGADIATASIAGFANDSNFKFRGLGIQSLEIFEKCQVDILGNISVVRHENRQEFH